MENATEIKNTCNTRAALVFAACTTTPAYTLIPPPSYPHTTTLIHSYHHPHTLIPSPSYPHTITLIPPPSYPHTITLIPPPSYHHVIPSSYLYYHLHTLIPVLQPSYPHTTTLIPSYHHPHTLIPPQPHLTHICSSEEKEVRGDRVPLVRMRDLTPWTSSSFMARPGLKHQYPSTRAGEEEGGV